jgi:type II secretory pathway component PulJ
VRELRQRSEQGFTLVELLIATGIAMILLGSIYSLFSSHYLSFREQEQVAEAQQNAVAGLQIMSRDLVMAGFSTANPGIVFANRTSLTIRNAASIITYRRYSGAWLGRTVNGSRQAVAEHIRRLSFGYKDTVGSPITPDGSGTVTAGYVRQIDVAITAGTPAFGRYSGSCTLTSTISPRNL